MRKHRRNVLLLFIGVALSVALVFVFDLHKYFLAWFWSIEDTLSILGKTWLIRRLERPITGLVTRWLIIGGIGFDRYGKFKKRASAPFVGLYTYFGQTLPNRPLRYRLMVTSGAFSCVSALLWLTWEIPLVLPVTGYLIGKLYWWGSDQLFDRTLYVFEWRTRINRVTHRNKAVRKVLGPYWLLRKSVEPRLERWREQRQIKKSDKDT